MKHIQTFLVFALLTFGLAHAQTVTLTVDEPFPCVSGSPASATINLNVAISGGTPVSISWSQNAGLFFPSSLTTDTSFTYIQNGSNAEQITPSVEVDFGGGNIITEEIDILLVPFEVDSNFSEIRISQYCEFLPNLSIDLLLGFGISSFDDDLPYTYTISDGAGYSYTESGIQSGFTSSILITNSGSIPELTPGQYTFDITFNLNPNCPIFFSYPFEIKPYSLAFEDVVNPSCGQPGSAKLVIQDGVPDFSVNVYTSNGTILSTITSDTVFILENLPAGFLTATVFDLDNQFSCDVAIETQLINEGFSIDATTTPASCGNDPLGAIDLTVTDTTGDVFYLWSNGATTQDIDSLTPGDYTVTITDDFCATVQTFTVENSTYQGTTAEVTAASCQGSNGGIDLTIVGGQPPFNILWSNGATTEDIDNLAAGGYAVSVTDANGCLFHKAFQVDLEPECRPSLSGTAFIDANNNCVLDQGEIPVGGSVILDNGYRKYLDGQGNFDLRTSPGNYVLQHSFVNNPSFLLDSCLPANQYNVNVVLNDIGDLDFAFEVPSPINDLAIYITQNPIRPGFDHTYYVHVKNEGTTPIAPTIFFNHDSLVTYLSHTGPGTYFPTNREVIWNPAVMNPGQELIYEVEANLPASVS
ncbi:MAG: hypothetical protein AAFP00_03570, partial [Bacteroidota bacterium]